MVPVAAEDDILLYRMAAQVEVAVLHAQVVAAVGIVFDGEGRHFGGVEYLHGRHLDLDVAGGAVGVLLLRSRTCPVGDDNEFAFTSLRARSQSSASSSILKTSCVMP